MALGAKARGVLQKLENNTEYKKVKKRLMVNPDFQVSDLDDSSLSDYSEFDDALSDFESIRSRSRGSPNERFARSVSSSSSVDLDYLDLNRITPSEPPDSLVYSVASLDIESMADSEIFTRRDESVNEKEKTLRNILQTPENIGTMPDYVQEELRTMIHTELTKKKMLPALQAAIKACTTLTTKSSLTLGEKKKIREYLKVYRTCTEIYKVEKIKDTAKQKNERAEKVYSTLAKMWTNNGNPPKEVSQSMSKYILEALANMDCEKIFSDIVYRH